MQLENVDFEIERVVENACALVQERAEAKGIELVIELRGVPPMLHGDRLRLGQILLNFVGNTIKFTESGTITIRGWVAGASDRGISLHLAVTDTGIVLDAEQQERLFNAFEQADTSTTRRYGGTGLGLTINRRLVDLIGGRIGLASEPGRGSTFWIEVPLAFAETQPATPATSHHTRGLRVLLIDDQAEARESLTDVLESLGMRVARLPDGSAALPAVMAAEADGEPFDIVLADWHMPGLDGITLGRQLTAALLARQPLRLLITARGQPPESLKGTGYREVLSKPLPPSRVHDAIQRLLASGAANSTPAVHGARRPEERLRAGSPRRILLVDDNAINREVAGELLLSVGLHVDFAEDGRQAVDRVRQTAYDLVLMDMQMPVPEGLQATREIRTLPGRATMPIIAMTANAFAEDRQACLDAGMNDHLAKPITPEILYEALLRRPLATRWCRRAPPATTRSSGGWRWSPALTSMPGYGSPTSASASTCACSSSRNMRRRWWTRWTRQITRAPGCLPTRSREPARRSVPRWCAWRRTALRQICASRRQCRWRDGTATCWPRRAASLPTARCCRRQSAWRWRQRTSRNQRSCRSTGKNCRKSSTAWRPCSPPTRSRPATFSVSMRRCCASASAKPPRGSAA